MTALPSGHAAPDGFVNEALTSYYLERARGGAAALVLEHAWALSPPDSITPHLGLYADAHVSDFRRCVSALHRAGSAVLVMLDQPLMLNGAGAADLHLIGEAFIEAAWRAHAASADGVMFSTADAGPFEQMVSPLHNRRTDRYGGSVDGRLLLLLHVVEGIQRWIGDRFVIGVRMNAEEFTPGGLTLQEARIIAQRLSSAGVRLLEVAVAPQYGVPVAQFPGWCVPLAASIRAVVDVPVMVGGLLDDVELADSIIRDGSADLVALDERLRKEPDWPQRALAALADRRG